MVHEVKTYVCTKDIDKKIKQILQEKPNEMGSYQFGFYTAIKYLWGELDKIPVADVVEVVRCEECKCLMKEIVVEQTPYGFENEKIEFGCQRILDLTGEWVDVMLDDFCSYGKRRSDEK